MHTVTLSDSMHSPIREAIRETGAKLTECHDGHGFTRIAYQGDDDAWTLIANYLSELRDSATGRDRGSYTSALSRIPNASSRYTWEICRLRIKASHAMRAAASVVALARIREILSPDRSWEVADLELIAEVAFAPECVR